MCTCLFLCAYSSKSSSSKMLLNITSMTPQISNTFDDHDDDSDSCILHLWQRHDSTEACKFIMKAEQEL